MSAPLTTSPLAHLTDLDQIETLIQQSHEAPVLIFKHSVSCGTSAFAFDQLQDHLAAQPASSKADAGAPAVHYAIVVVQTHRALSNAIATRLGVRHETPQALLLRDGRVVWHASHHRLEAATITRAIASHGRTPATPPRP